MTKPIIYRGRQYPADWPQIARAIKERGGWHCEWCNAAHGEAHPKTGSRVVLTVHHLGAPDLAANRPGDKHNKLDCRPENLVALCQRCHLWADLDDHLEHAALTRRRNKIRAGQIEFEVITREV